MWHHSLPLYARLTLDKINIWRSARAFSAKSTRGGMFARRSPEPRSMVLRARVRWLEDSDTVGWQLAADSNQCLFRCAMRAQRCLIWNSGRGISEETEAGRLILGRFAKLSSSTTSNEQGLPLAERPVFDQSFRIQSFVSDLLKMPSSCKELRK